MPDAKINVPRMMLETAQNYTDPREILRELIQDSLDAGAKTIRVDVNLVDTAEGQSVNFNIEDDGSGIPANNFSNFFDAANSTKTEENNIGYKGLGTSICYNSNRIILESWVDGVKYCSVADKPYASLYNNQPVTYLESEVVPNVEEKVHGTRVTIEGYLKNSGENFIDHYSHAPLRDYVLWDTAFGSIRGQFENIIDPPILFLHTYDSDVPALQKEFKYKIQNGYEEIPFGHVFPDKEVTSIAELKKLAIDARDNHWEDYFSKRIFAKEIFIDGLKKPVQIVIWLEGDKCKKSYNPMIRGKNLPKSATRNGMYTVQQKYGLILCKRYIPIQQSNEWIVGKGSYTKYHAFINYDDFSLTSNRSSINNTNPNTIKKIKDKLNEILDELQKKKEFKEISDLQTAAGNERSAASEDAEFAQRLKKSKTRKSLMLGNVRYYEPIYEGEAALLFDGILQTFPESVNFEILDYNTHDGVDFLTRSQPDIPLENDNTLGFTELKHNLEKQRLNHSFLKLRNIVIYDAKGIKTGNTLVDLSGKMLQFQKKADGWILADFQGEVGHSIKVFVMKDFLESKGIVMS